MARPKKDGLDYFPHDVYASSDPKVEPLILLYGATGYAFFFLHLEYIYRNPELFFDISDAETREVICQKLKITQEEYEAILQTSLKHKCFDKTAFEEQGVLTSNGVKKRASVVTEKRKKMQKYYETKNTDISDAETGEETTPETPQSKVKESKVNKSKEKESKQNKSKVTTTTTDDEKNPFKFFSQNIGLITQFQSEFIESYIKDGVEQELITLILQDSIGKGNPWHWFKTVLENSYKQNIKTIEDYETKKIERKKQWERDHGFKTGGKPVNAANFKQREYDDNYFDDLYENT